MDTFDTCKCDCIFPGSNFDVFVDFTCGTSPGSPVYSKEGGGAMYLSWSTSYACATGASPAPPTSPPTSPPAGPCGYYADDGTYYDFSSAGTLSVVQTDLPTYTIWFDLCEPLVAPVKDTCVAGQTYACQHSTATTSNAVASVKPTKATGADGNIQLLFTGGATCPGQPGSPARSVNYILFCGTTVGTPTFISEVACQYTISWTTIYACPVEPPTPTVPSCVFDAPGSGAFQIDLRPLSRQIWSTPNSEFASDTEYIGVCGAYPSEYISGCPVGATVCESTLAAYLSYGEDPFTHSFSADSTLLLTFATAVDSCRSSTIEFVCDPEAPEDAGPVHVSNSDDHCLQTFLWKTSLACPKQTCHPNADGYDFDLSDLIGRTYTVANPFIAGETAHLALCDEIVADVVECNNAGWSACQTSDSSRPLELGSAPVSYAINDAGNLVMSYGYANPFASSIEFFCDESAGGGQPQLYSIGSNGTDYKFVWPSTYGCVLPSF